MHDEIEAIRRIITCEYELANITQITKIDGGEENANYKVAIGSQNFVFRIYAGKHSFKGPRTATQLEIEFAFMEAVREKGIPVPNAIARPDGSSFGYDSVLGRFFALFEFMVGDILDEGFSRWSVKQIAECLDVLYEVSIESRELVRNDDSFNQSIISRAQKAYAELDNYPGKEIPNVLVGFFDSCMKDNQRVSDLAEGLIHGDVKIQNLLFNNMILSALLDFDDCRKSYVIEDVVMALMHNLHSIDDCLIRSEYAQEFIDSISNPRLRQELRSGLSVLIKWRLLYELSKLLLNDNRSHFDILLQDAFIQRIIEDKEFIKV